MTLAQQVTHVAKTNPFGRCASQYQLGYEHGLNDNFSVQLWAAHCCSDFNACPTGMPRTFFRPQYKTVDTSGNASGGIFINDDNVGVRFGVNLGFGW